METTTTKEEAVAKHYHLFILADGKDHVKREYVEISDPDNPGTREEATEKFLDTKINGRQRNRDRAKNQIRETIVGYTLCRPSSWYQEKKLGSFGDGEKKKSTTKRKGN